MYSKIGNYMSGNGRQGNLLFISCMVAAIFLSGTLFFQGLNLNKDLLRETVFLLFCLFPAFYGLFTICKNPDRIEVFKNPVCISVMIFQFMLLLSTVFSKDVSASFFGSYYRHMGFSVILPLTSLALFMPLFSLRKKDIQLLLFSIILFITLNSLYGIFQSVGLDFSSSNGIGIKTPFSIRPTGFTGNPDFFAPLILFGIFPAVSFSLKFLHEKKPLLFSLFLSSFFIQTAAIIASMTRGTWVALFIGAISYCLISSIFISTGRKKIWKFVLPMLITAGILISAAIFSLIFIPKFATFFTDKILSIFTLNQKYFYTGELVPVERPFLWRDTLYFCADLFRQGSILGVGLENFNKYFMPYKSLELAQININKLYDNPHNFYLYILASSGIPGLLAFLSMLFFSFRSAIRLFKGNEDSSNRLVIAGVTASLFAYCVNLLSSFEVLQMGILFYIFIGILCSMQNAPDTEPHVEKIPAKSTGILLAAYCLLIGAVTLTGISDVTRQIFADYAFKKGLVENSRENPDLDKTISCFKSACLKYPREAFYADELMRAYGLKANSLQKSNNDKGAEQYYALGLELLNKYEKKSSSPSIIYMSAGLNSYRVGLLDNAIDMFEASLAWDGWNTHVHTLLSNLYFFRFSITKDDEDLVKAFNHSYTSILILKFFPHTDFAAFNNSIKYANIAYGKNKDPNILATLSEILMIYAKIAKKSPETDKEFIDSIKLADGTRYQNEMLAAMYFMQFRTGILSPDATLRKINGLRIDGVPHIKDYIGKIGQKTKGGNLSGKP